MQGNAFVDAFDLQRKRGWPLSSYETNRNVYPYVVDGSEFRPENHPLDVQNPVMYILLG